ncbi:Undecaprenyl phosphate-alpha-4-amino-4-deoxy-L-arabinose arabinosyl transferase [Sporomusa rhizae]|uniref:ArnT family glycosyltransferase n=1 Tax=Sporomusa rhizae TaxID=357999 RepID=UPI00352AB13F
MAHKNKSLLWIVLGITAFVIFFHLGSSPLLDPDEPVYAETPKEMILFGDYISPRIYGEYWYDKPPMYYWLVAAAFKVFGVNEFAARFPSALLGVLCVLLVYRAGTRFFGQTAGVVGALVLTTSIEYFYVAKAAVTDITLTLCLTAALLSFLEKKYYLMYLFAALATVTKGPIGLVFPGAILFLYFLATKNWQEIKNMKIPAGIIIYAVVALPWYIAMYQFHGNAFLDTFIGFHNVARFTTAEHTETSGWYFFIPVLMLGFFPWTALLVQSVRASLLEGRKQKPALLFLNIWVLFIFIFFTISSTKLVTYILPMYPPLALLVGWYLGRWIEGYQPKGWRYSWPVVLSGLVLLLVAGMYLGVKMMPELTTGLILLSVVMIMMAGTVWYAVKRGNPSVGFWGQVVAMSIAATIFIAVLLPAAAPQFTTRGIASQFSAVYDGKSPVYVVKFLHPGFTFYTNVYGTEVLTSADISKAVAKNSSAYYVMRQLEYKALGARERADLTIVAQSNEMLLLKQ